MRYSETVLNRLAVLKTIRSEGPIARTDLPGATGLSGGTITQLTADLLERGLIHERKDQARRGGRPRTFLDIDAEAAIMVGGSLRGPGLFDISFVDLAGERRFHVEARIGRHVTLASMASEMAVQLAQAIEASPFAKTRISRVAIALPAIVNSITGEIHFMVTFSPEEFPAPFAAPISERIGLPVTIENEIICMARAEHWLGRARGLNNFTLLYAGLTIGSAEYSHGVPVVGGNGLNPEIGHMKIEAGPDARPCYCGGAGCVTVHASMYGILHSAKLLDDLPFPPLKAVSQRFFAFLDLAESGDAKARAAFAAAGAHLGLAVANLINTSNPDALLVAISDARYLDLMRASFDEALKQGVMPGLVSATRLEFIIEDRNWRWKGAAMLALEQTYLGQGRGVGEPGRTNVKADRERAKP